jgi:hypothetical protein
MKAPNPGPAVSVESVRTLHGRLCPICDARELRGRQTACSAACRRERSRQLAAARIEHRERRLRSALERAGQIIQEALKP